MQQLSPDALTPALLQPHPATHYWIAYSGGLDSQVLLHLCAAWRAAAPDDPAFTAIHIHHGLQADADEWARHCERSCRDLNIPFDLRRVDARPKPGESPEEAARDARYQVFRSVLGENEVLLSAQHRDDQAETVLLQLMRGAGLAGLAAMPACTDFGRGQLRRPLLKYSRRDLREYAEHYGLHWVEDPSNASLDFDRNFLRHRVIPLLEERWPGVKKSLGRTAGHCAEALERVERLAHDLYRSALNDDEITLCASRLQHFDPADRRWVLRLWLRESGYRMPAQTILERIAHELLDARPDRQPVVSWPEGEVRRYRDTIYVLPPACPFDPKRRLIWDGVTPLDLPDGNGVLSAEESRNGGIDQAVWRRSAITVRYRSGGERCRLPARAGTHTLKKLLQEFGIPPWERPCLPLIELNGELAAVADRIVCTPFYAPPGQAAVRVRWERRAETD